jgi:hypothetical protein
MLTVFVPQVADEVRGNAIAARAAMNDEMNEDGPIDCLIWKKASTAYKKQAAALDRKLMFVCAHHYTTKQVLCLFVFLFKKKRV